MTTIRRSQFTAAENRLRAKLAVAGFLEWLDQPATHLVQTPVPLPAENVKPRRGRDGKPLPEWLVECLAYATGGNDE